jgi:hypothetical protein
MQMVACPGAHPASETMGTGVRLKQQGDECMEQDLYSPYVFIAWYLIN